jgi:hypothetical protein
VFLVTQPRGLPNFNFETNGRQVSQIVGPSQEWATTYPWLQCRLDLARQTFGLGCTLCEIATKCDELKQLGSRNPNVAAFHDFTIKATVKTDLRAQRSGSPNNRV